MAKIAGVGGWPLLIGVRSRAQSRARDKLP